MRPIRPADRRSYIKGELARDIYLLSNKTVISKKLTLKRFYIKQTTEKQQEIIYPPPACIIGKASAVRLLNI